MAIATANINDIKSNLQDWLDDGWMQSNATYKLKGVVYKEALFKPVETICEQTPRRGAAMVKAGKIGSSVLVRGKGCVAYTASVSANGDIDSVVNL